MLWESGCFSFAPQKVAFVQKRKKPKLGLFVLQGLTRSVAPVQPPAPSLSVRLPPPAFQGVPDRHTTCSLFRLSALPARQRGRAGRRRARAPAAARRVHSAPRTSRGGRRRAPPRHSRPSPGKCGKEGRIRSSERSGVSFSYRWEEERPNFAWEKGTVAAGPVSGRVGGWVDGRAADG